MKTKTQLISLVAIAGGGIIFLGVISLFFFSHFGRTLEASIVQGERIEKTINSTRIVHVNFQLQMQEWKNILIRGNDPQRYDQHLKDFGAREESVQANLKELKGLINEVGMDGTKIDSLIQAHLELGKKYREALGSYDKTNPNSMHAVDKLAAGIDLPASSSMDDLVGMIDKEAQLKLNTLRNEASQAASQGKIVLLVAIVGGLLIVVTASGVIGRNIFSQLGGELSYVTDIAKNIAEGDLTARIDTKQGDNASLLVAIAHMREGLRATVSEIISSAVGVAASAEALSTAARQVVDCTQAQSESTATSAAAIEQFTVSIEHIAENAHHASTNATEAGKLAEEGNQAVEYATTQIMSLGEGVDKTTADIQVLSNEVEKIGNVAVVIKGVADQTNLLALNAAIEAARAGEQGRGFAVVADEVRKLSERTTNAVVEISRMIIAIRNETSASVESMQRNRELASNAVGSSSGATGSMVQISCATDSVVAAIGELSNALNEQRSVATGLARNMEVIAQMAEENSATTDALAATSHEMEALSSKLNMAVSRFRL